MGLNNIINSFRKDLRSVLVVVILCCDDDEISKVKYQWNGKSILCRAKDTLFSLSFTTNNSVGSLVVETPAMEVVRIPIAFSVDVVESS